MKKLLHPAKSFVQTEAGAGLLLLAMVPVALIWANGPLANSYAAFWSSEIPLGINLSPTSLTNWVNEGLMTIFFFVVGLEIKRELVRGELSTWRKAATPALAAIGGMLVPALIYISINRQQPEANGWAIPMATDIAIMLGILALLGSRVPAALKTFFLSLAIIDDLGAILVIGLFYSAHGLNLLALALTIALLGAIFALRKIKRDPPAVIFFLSIATWLATYESGLHATLAGVALALLTPARRSTGQAATDSNALPETTNVKHSITSLAELEPSKLPQSKLEWLERKLHPWSSYLVLPLFALANAGIPISGDSIQQLASPVAVGVIVGLAIGKPIGITLATLIATKALHLRLPTGISERAIAAGSILAGVGFTVSLFISNLAFSQGEPTSQAKAAVLAASIGVGAIGYFALRLTLAKQHPTP